MKQFLNLNLQKGILYPNRMRQFLNLNLQKWILNRNLTRRRRRKMSISHLIIPLPHLPRTQRKRSRSRRRERSRMRRSRRSGQTLSRAQGHPEERSWRAVRKRPMTHAPRHPVY